jgi:hypothetical protein
MSVKRQRSWGESSSLSRMISSSIGRPMNLLTRHLVGHLVEGLPVVSPTRENWAVVDG